MLATANVLSGPMGPSMSSRPRKQVGLGLRCLTHLSARNIPNRAQCPKLALFCPILGRSLVFSMTYWLCFAQKLCVAFPDLESRICGAVETAGGGLRARDRCVSSPTQAGFTHRLRTCEKIPGHRPMRLRRLPCGKPAAFRERLNPRSLILSVRSGRAEPFRTSGGRAAIFSHLLSLSAHQAAEPLFFTPSPPAV